MKRVDFEIPFFDSTILLSSRCCTIRYPRFFVASTLLLINREMKMEKFLIFARCFEVERKTGVEKEKNARKQIVRTVWLGFEQTFPSLSTLSWKKPIRVFRNSRVSARSDSKRVDSYVFPFHRISLRNARNFPSVPFFIPRWLNAMTYFRWEFSFSLPRWNWTKPEKEFII